MSERIFTLFGEEFVPEQPKAAPKAKAKKKPEEKKEDAPEVTENTPVDAHETTAAPVQEPVAEVAETVAEQPAVQEAAEEMPAPAQEAATPVAEEAPLQQEAIAQPVAEVLAEPAGQPQETHTEEPVAQAEEKKKAKKEKVVIEEPTDGKQYYSIGEVADMFKVKTSHIRFWTTEFNLKVRTTRKGDRLYNMDQIKELRAIHHLVKERGFTLAGARTKLKEEKKKNIEVESVDLKKSLLHLRAKLVAIKTQLK
jgi:DNA-binding transcriptional MerR regulator